MDSSHAGQSLSPGARNSRRRFRQRELANPSHEMVIAMLNSRLKSSGRESSVHALTGSPRIDRWSAPQRTAWLVCTR